MMSLDSQDLPRRPSWDAYLVGILALAHLRILAFGEQVALPLDMRLNDILRHPLLGNILPPTGEQAFGPIGPLPVEPIGLLLHAATIGFVILYFIVDLLPARRPNTELLRSRLKWTVLAFLICFALVLPTVKLMLLRDISGPASYTHDGGVIQTEITVNYFLTGKNPYVEDYLDTPMAEWGISEYRTALYHYPYLPWTFIFSSLFYLIGQLTGFYDQRIVYLLLMLIALYFLPRLAGTQSNKLALVAAIALNPLMTIDIVFGQNDSFVLCWIIFSLICLQQWRTLRSQGLTQSQTEPQSTGSNNTGLNNNAAIGFKTSIFPNAHRWLVASVLLFGLACASKPTAWFFAPFYGLLLVREEIAMNHATQSRSPRRSQISTIAQNWLLLVRHIPLIIRRALPALAIFAALIGPYLIWDAYAFYDDVWRWSNGRGETGYQIWGWGLSNFVLGFGLVADRFSQWPFLVTQAIIAGPLLLWTIYRQLRDNSISAACWHYALFLLAFFYASRFLNENYLGYVAAFFAIGLFSTEESTGGAE